MNLLKENPDLLHVLVTAILIFAHVVAGWFVYRTRKKDRKQTLWFLSYHCLFITALANGLIEFREWPFREIITIPIVLLLVLLYILAWQANNQDEDHNHNEQSSDE